MSMDMALLSCAPGAMSMDMALLSCAPVPCQWTWHYSAAPRYHVNGYGTTKLRPGGMSMDMALLSCAPVKISTIALKLRRMGGAQKSRCGLGACIGLGDGDGTGRWVMGRTVGTATLPCRGGRGCQTVGGTTTGATSFSYSSASQTTILLNSRRPVPAGMRWPQMTFSFMPSR